MPIAGDSAAAPVRLGRSWGLPAWNQQGEVLVSEDSELVAWRPGPAPLRRVVAKLPTGLRATALAPFADGELLALCGTFNQDTTPSLRRLLPDGTLGAFDVGPISPYGIVAAPSQDGFYYLRRAAAGTDELVRHARRGGAPVVVQGGVAPSGGFAIAPDRRRMAYSTCKNSSYLARLGGAKPEPLGAQDPSWLDMNPAAVDDHRLVFTSDCGGAPQIWLLDTASGEARALTGRDTGRAAVSPDGELLAYTNHAQPGIHVQPLAGGPARRLSADASDTGAAFTASSRQVVFVRSGPDGDHLFTVPALGGTPRQLTAEVTSVAAVSPAEDRIVYLTTDRDRAALMATDAAGSPPVPIGPALPPGYYTGLRFSRDGKHLLVVYKEVEVLELGLDATPPVVRWHAGVEAVDAVDYAPGGGIVASLTRWNGDLWLAEGEFP